MIQLDKVNIEVLLLNQSGLSNSKRNNSCFQLIDTKPFRQRHEMEAVAFTGRSMHKFRLRFKMYDGLKKFSARYLHHQCDLSASASYNLKHDLNSAL